MFNLRSIFAAGLMLGVVANEKQSAMHAGMQRLYAAVQHLREAGQFADVLHSEPGFPEGLRCSTG